jgi:hypothetical protein
MSEEKGNESAFPSWTMLEQFDDEVGRYVKIPVTIDGLTKREWFAGLAVQSVTLNQYGNFETVAKKAVAIADALLAELSKEEK